MHPVLCPTPLDYVTAPPCHPNLRPPPSPPFSTLKLPPCPRPWNLLPVTPSDPFRDPAGRRGGGSGERDFLVPPPEIPPRTPPHAPLLAAYPASLALNPLLRAPPENVYKFLLFCALNYTYWSTSYIVYSNGINNNERTVAA